MNKLFSILAAMAIGLPTIALAYQLEINGHIYNDESGAPLSVDQVTVVQAGSKIIVKTLPGDTDKVCYDNCSSGPANQAPNISTTSLSNSEGATAVGTVLATDPDGNLPLTFSLNGGTNANLFSITAAGVLSFNSASTAGTYTVNVKVTDSAQNPLSDTQAITVTAIAVGSCGPTPGNVNISTSFNINWAVSKPNTFLAVDNTDITSIPVTTSAAQSSGFVVFAATASTIGVTRTLWISECPGGPAFVPANWDPAHPSAVFFGNKCTVTGASNKQVSWNMKGDIYPTCALSNNTNYYINVQNNTCTAASCNVFLGFVTNE